MALDLPSRSDRALSEGSALNLARLALRAEEASLALEEEHCDVLGRLPEAIEARARELSCLSDRLGDVARRRLP